MTISYWQAKNKPLGHHRQGKPSGEYNIAVVGGGLIGIATAYHLKSLGCDRLVVLEKEYVGYGASGRNAGFLLSGMAEPYSRLVVGLGPEGARALMTATLENHDLISEAVKGEKINCDYRKAGSYHLAVSDVEMRELSESVELLHKDGFCGELIDSKTISEKLGLGNYAGGYFCPADGCLDPYAFVNGLARGLDIIEGFEVKSIRKTAGRIEMVGNEYAVKAEMGVLATNAYSPLLDGFFKEMIFPVRGQMLAAGSRTGGKLGDATYYANFGYDYFRQSSDHIFLMGGLRDKFIETEIGFGDQTNPALQGGLENYLRTNIRLDRFDVLHRWSGVMANTIDGLPLVGTLPHNSSVIAAVGCNGHGFGWGTVIARDVARAIMKNEMSELLKRFSIKRFAG
jgi:gamma-glutamylputrescine oxidase